jgi:FtsP/CotA-like multicopper oxidase with cupredoxin domain
MTRRAALGWGAALAAAPAIAAAERVQGHVHPEPAPAAPRPAEPAPETAPRPSSAAPRTPERPWLAAERARHQPGEPGRDYRPVFVPDGATLPYRLVGGVKIFHLVAEPIVHQLAEGLTIRAWGYNGRTPGPVIEAVAGDRVRIYVTNRLPSPTSVHWHGQLVPNGMDGVAGLTQPDVPVGATFRYEFVCPQPATFLYHPHFEEMTEGGMGMAGLFVVHPRPRREPPPDREFAILLQEWRIDPGTARPFANEMVEFNLLTMNGRAFPDTHPLVCRLGDRVRIRLGNLSQMSHHPIHIHGHTLTVAATDGGVIPPSARWPETTVLVPVGSSRDVDFVADNPGDWPLHCHMFHHMMNQMGHDLPNMVGVRVPAELDAKIRRLLPGYMTMGQAGMGEMAAMHGMPVPENTIPMKGLRGPFGDTVFGGMSTVVKVRERLTGYDDPGWYDHPPGTVAGPASEAELARDGIDPPEPADEPGPWTTGRGPGGHGGHGGGTAR